jgi:hypothetical protein
VIPGWGGLARVALRARHLALHHRDDACHSSSSF